MMKSLRHALWLALKYGISLFCLVYAFWDVPFSDLLVTLKHYPVLPMFGVVAVSFAAYAVMGVRLSHMVDPPLTFRSTFAATLAGLAINNVLPDSNGNLTLQIVAARPSDKEPLITTSMGPNGLVITDSVPMCQRATP